MNDFIKWLFRWDTDPLWQVLFMIGAMAVGIVTLGVLYVVAWPLGVLATLGLLFGPPYLAYRKSQKTKKDE